MLYEAAGAGTLLVLEAVFWRAMLARASRMDEPLAGAGAAAGAEPPCRETRALGGGLPGGVVEISIQKVVRKSTLLVTNDRKISLRS